MKYDEAQGLAKQIAELVRARMLLTVTQHEAALARSFQKMAEGIRRDLQAIGFTIDQVSEILDKHLKGTREERADIIAQSITDAARSARALDQQTFEAVFGAEATTEEARPFSPASEPKPTRSLTLVRAFEEKPPSTD